MSISVKKGSFLNMERTVVRFCIIVLYHTVLVNSFNLETNVLRYLQSPVVQALTASSSTSAGQLPRGTKPSYFGYDFHLAKSGPNLRFTVGAPKTIVPGQPALQSSPPTSTSSPQPATGDLLECPVSNLFASTPANPTCNSRNPPGAQRGDAFGQSVDISPSGQLTACSPTKQQSCGPDLAYSPGYCYNSQNRGLTWETDAETKKLKCPIIDMDLMFVLDGSGSVGIKSFEIVKNWTINVAGSFDISTGLTQVGVVQYSHYWPTQAIDQQSYIKTEVPLGKFRDINKFGRAVRNISLHTYTTYTAHALNKTILDFQNSSRWSSKTKKVLILLTDGLSTDKDLVPSTAQYVRSLNITTFAVGVGKANTAELQEIANGKNTNERVYYTSNFGGLNEIVSKLRSAILNFVLEGYATAPN